MLEFPEVIRLSRQLQAHVTGKRVRDVLPPAKEHKFCWFNGDPKDYASRLVGAAVTGAEGFGIFAELQFDNGLRLCVNDGVNVRLTNSPKDGKDYQLLLLFTDGTALVFTVMMYGGIVLHDQDYANEYYSASRQSVSPLSEKFDAAFLQRWEQAKPSLSAKAFLATEQRFPGLGNGVLQDVLLACGIHPKRKISTLSAAERDDMLYCVKAVLSDMTQRGGRNTEKDLFGKSGGYVTRLSRLSLKQGCPQCGGEIVKQPYLGGAVYFCPVCQPETKERE